jgi:hypothetical protein
MPAYKWLQGRIRASAMDARLWWSDVLLTMARFDSTSTQFLDQNSWHGLRNLRLKVLSIFTIGDPRSLISWMPIGEPGPLFSFPLVFCLPPLSLTGHVNGGCSGALS